LGGHGSREKKVSVHSISKSSSSQEVAVMAMKPNGKSIVSTGKSPVVMYFKDISPGPHESKIRFRLIHFWEARNIAEAKTLIGLEMLIIDEQVIVMQGFIPANRVQQYLCDLKRGSVLSPLDYIPVSVSFPADRFSFHTQEDFQANRGLRDGLYDVVGHLRLVNGQSLIDRPVFEEAEMISKRHSLVYVQSKEYVFTVIMIASSCTAKLTL
ncbi:hypothetical protein HID58_020533, partial [Brassica napus]